MLLNLIKKGILDFHIAIVANMQGAVRKKQFIANVFIYLLTFFLRDVIIEHPFIHFLNIIC